MEVLAREYAALKADDPRRAEIITEMLALTSTQRRVRNVRSQ